MSSLPAVDRPSAPDASAPPAGPRVLLHMPVDVRSAALAVVAVVVVLHAMDWAQAVLVPLLFGVMAGYALSPAVDALERRLRVPRVVGAALVLVLIVGGCAVGLWSLRNQADAFVDSLPRVAQTLRELAQGARQSSSGTIDKVQKMAEELEKVAHVPDPAASAPARPGNAPAPAPPPTLDLRRFLWTGTLGALAFAGQTVAVLFFTFFMLASGDGFRRKLVRLAGPRLSQKRVTLEALKEIDEQIQRYLLVQFGVGAVVGIATGVAFYVIGLPQPAAWGVIAGVTNLVPYVGLAITTIGPIAVAAAQSGTLEPGLWAAASSMAIHAVVGNLLTPWWLGQTSRLNPLAVFVGVLVFGWLWGVPGLLLGVPVLLVVKAVCDRVDDLKAVGDLLG